MRVFFLKCYTQILTQPTHFHQKKSVIYLGSKKFISLWTANTELTPHPPDIHQLLSASLIHVKTNGWQNALEQELIQRKYSPMFLSTLKRYPTVLVEQFMYETQSKLRPIIIPIHSNTNPWEKMKDILRLRLQLLAKMDSQWQEVFI